MINAAEAYKAAAEHNCKSEWELRMRVKALIQEHMLMGHFACTTLKMRDGVVYDKEPDTEERNEELRQLAFDLRSLGFNVQHTRRTLGSYFLLGETPGVDIWYLDIDWSNPA